MNKETESRLPIGSYKDSCRNGRVETDSEGSTWLVAECKRIDGSWLESRLQLKEVHNFDGRLEYGLESNTRETWNDAIDSANEDQVALLLRVIPELATTGVLRTRRNGTTYELPALHVANKSLSVAKLLVEAGADCSPGLAWYGASPEVLEYLLSLHPDTDAGDMLMQDSYAGLAANVEIYLRHGTLPEPWPELESKCSPLHAACFYSQRMRGFDSEDGFDPVIFRETVKTLLDGGADVNAKMAIEKECDIGPVSIHAETPLHYAAAGGDIVIVKMLVDAGADPHSENSLGETPLDWSEKYYGNEEIERLLQ